MHTCVKVGCAEAIRTDLDLGDIIIPAACMRKGGAVTHYVKPEFPAFADPRVVKALIEACRRLGYRYTMGVVCSISSYYVGQGRPLDGDEESFFPPEAANVVDRLRNAKVVAVDNETAGELVMGYLHKMRMGAVLAVNANRVTEPGATTAARRRPAASRARRSASCGRRTPKKPSARSTPEAEPRNRKGDRL